MLCTETVEEAGCECTESNLADIKLTRKSISTIPTKQQVDVFKAVMDDIETSSNADLASALYAGFLKTSPSEAQAGKRFFQCWDDVILLYPNVLLLTTYVESNLQTYPDMAPVLYQNAQLIGASFVR